MTNEHKKYLTEGITRIATHCDQWKDGRTWDEHSQQVNADLAAGDIDKYKAILKSSMTADKAAIRGCHINDSYIVCIMHLLKIYKEDYIKGPTHKNNIEKADVKKGGKFDHEIRNQEKSYRSEQDEHVL